jgi:hypothetical protein
VRAAYQRSRGARPRLHLPLPRRGRTARPEAPALAQEGEAAARAVRDGRGYSILGRRIVDEASGRVPTWMMGVPKAGWGWWCEAESRMRRAGRTGDGGRDGSTGAA